MNKETKTIYLVHEYGGEYSDRWDNIIGAFEKREDALNLGKIRAKRELEMRKKADKDYTYHEENYYYIGSLLLNKEDIE